MDKEKQQSKQKMQELNRTKDELEQYKRKLKKFTQLVIVRGLDNYNQLGENLNNNDDINQSLIGPPLKLSLDFSSLLSYSVYYRHSVFVTNGGKLLGIGDNENGRINSILPKAKINQFTEFSIKNESGYQLIPISAVCLDKGTLYMFSNSNGIDKQLVHCDCDL